VPTPSRKGVPTEISQPTEMPLPDVRLLEVEPGPHRRVERRTNVNVKVNVEVKLHLVILALVTLLIAVGLAH
jgi:hypothetical protein